MSLQLADPPFTFLCSLFREISHVESRPAKSTQPRYKQTESPALQIFKRWLNVLHVKFNPISEELTASILRLMFPEEDAKRRYMMQETRIIQKLAQCYGVDPRKFAQWDKFEGSGCLGDEVRAVLQESNSRRQDYIGPLSILEVDQLLTELASHCPFSDKSIRNRKSGRSQADIISQLYRDMSPEDASYLTQIILRDLRPLLYPMADTHSTAALLHFNTRSVSMLTKVQVLRAFDPAILKAYRVQADFDLAVKGLAHVPEVGVVIDVPKSQKGQSCRHSLEFLRSSRRVWAETKYDGERAQIHITMQEGRPKIQIFSKSKRDSTLDRKGVHDVILQAIGSKITRNVILDAEMVAFDGDRVDEFWRIRRLIDTTAEGIRHNWSKHRPDNSQISLASDDSETRRLGLVFFDILMLEGMSLLSTPYEARRNLLESVIRPTSGRAILAERYPIDMSAQDPESALAKVFAHHIADFQEGLVLKAEESRYNDYKLPWVKFKRDYIPGYGDTVDLVLVGASWEKERARELRVGPNTLTTFYFGAVDKERKGKKHHIEVIFTASYGLTREQLEQLNFLVRSSDSLAYPLPKGRSPDCYTFNLYAALSPPLIMLHRPLLVELFGAGFTKSPQCRYYELRWPRMTKVFRSSERSWTEGLDLQAFQDIAYASVGREKSDKDIDDCVRAMFGKSVEAGVKCPLRRKKIADEWEEKLCAMDGKTRQKRQPLGLAVPETRSLKRRTFNDHAPGATEQITSFPASNKPAEQVSTPVKRLKLMPVEDNCQKSTGKMKGTKVPLGVVTNTMPTSGIQQFNTPPVHTQDGENSRGADPPASVLPLPARQLPTPSTSPVRPSPAQHKTVDTADLLKAECNIERILQGAHVAFVRFGNCKCKRYSKLRRVVPTERHIHSVESLLAACGWSQAGAMGAYVVRGVVVVEEHGEGSDLNSQEVMKLLQRLQICSESGEEKDKRRPVTIVMCDGRIYHFA